jgi:hypothetical protein
MSPIKETLQLKSSSCCAAFLGEVAMVCLVKASDIDPLFVRFGLDIICEVSWWLEANISTLAFKETKV